MVIEILHYQIVIKEMSAALRIGNDANQTIVEDFLIPKRFSRNHFYER